MGNYYNAASAVVSVTCAKTTVTIPSLSGTSFATTGSNVGPTVKNYDSSLMTQSGTASTNVLGTYEVKWTLRDTTKYCWTDGTTEVKKASWTCTAGTITFYVSWSGYTSTFTCPYGSTGANYASFTKVDGKIYAGNGAGEWRIYQSDSSSAYGGYTAYLSGQPYSSTVITNGAWYYPTYYKRVY